MVGLINVAAGLSAAGYGVANWAHDMGLQAMKQDLELQQIALSDKLQRDRSQAEWDRSHSPEALDFAGKQAAVTAKGSALGASEAAADPAVRARKTAQTLEDARTQAAAAADPSVLASQATAGTAKARQAAADAVLPEVLAAGAKKAATEASASTSARLAAEGSPAAIAAAAARKAAETTAEINAELQASGGTTLEELAQPHIANILFGDYNLQNVPEYPKGLRNIVGKGVADAQSADPTKMPPRVAESWSKVSERVVRPIVDSATYKLARDSMPFYARVQSGLAHPGAAGDAEAVDGFMKMSSGNAVTDAQVKLITDGASLSDVISRSLNYLRSGGELSDQMRLDIKKITEATFDAYQKSAQPLVDEAKDKLRALHVPERLWQVLDVSEMARRAREDIDAEKKAGTYKAPTASELSTSAARAPASVAPAVPVTGQAETVQRVFTDREKAAMPHIKSAAERDALPPKTFYITPDGTVGRRP